MYQGRLQPVSFVVLTLTITHNPLRDAFIFFVNLLPLPYANALDIIFYFQRQQQPPAFPPPIYPNQPQSTSSYSSSLPSQHSFREEAPSSTSSMRNPSATGEWIRMNERQQGSQGSSASYDDVHSFHSEEPSVLYNNNTNQPVLRPPSYHEAIGQPSGELVSHIYVDQLRPSATRPVNTVPDVDPRFSPPPGYSTIDPRLWNQPSAGYPQPPARSNYGSVPTSGSQTSGFITAGRQPVSLSRPETSQRVPQNDVYPASVPDAERYEDRVRQRREGHRFVDSGSLDRGGGDVGLGTRDSAESLRAREESVPVPARQGKQVRHV